MRKKLLLAALLTILSARGFFAQQNVSPVQKHLFSLLDAYKTDYAAAKDAAEQFEVQKRFGATVRGFLVDSLQQKSDSITVTVGRIKQLKNGTLVTRLYSGAIEFRYSGKLEQLPASQRDTLLHFIKTVKRHSVVTLGFFYQKGGIVSKPNNKRFQPLILFAIPVPLHFHSAPVEPATPATQNYRSPGNENPIKRS